jgi:four helix bundle protein
MGSKHNFRELKVWRDSVDLCTLIYKLSAQLPSTENFGLKSQIQRSAVSISSNIAEGSGRGSDKEFIHFLNIAKASSFELETQLVIVEKIFELEVKEVILKIIEIQKMISGLQKSLTT